MWKGWSVVTCHPSPLHMYVSMHTKVLIQTMDFYSAFQEYYSIRLLPVRKFERIYLKKDSFTDVDGLLLYHLTHSIHNLGQNSKKIFYCV